MHQPENTVTLVAPETVFMIGHVICHYLLHFVQSTITYLTAIVHIRTLARYTHACTYSNV